MRPEHNLGLAEKEGASGKQVSEENRFVKPRGRGRGRGVGGMERVRGPVVMMGKIEVEGLGGEA